MRKYIRYTQCERETINGHAHVGSWQLETKKCIVAGPYNEDTVDDRQIAIMGLATTMPGSVEIISKKQAACLTSYAHFNGVPPGNTTKWDDIAWAKWDAFVKQEKLREYINLGCPDDTVKRFVEAQAKEGINLIISDDPRYDGGELDVRKMNPTNQKNIETIYSFLTSYRDGHKPTIHPTQFDDAIAFVKKLLPSSQGEPCQT